MILADFQTIWSSHGRKSKRRRRNSLRRDPGAPKYKNKKGKGLNGAPIMFLTFSCSS